LVYWKCLCSFFFKNNTWYLLFMLYCAVIYNFGDSLDFPPCKCPNRALETLFVGQQKLKTTRFLKDMQERKWWKMRILCDNSATWEINTDVDHLMTGNRFHFFHHWRLLRSCKYVIVTMRIEYQSIRISAELVFHDEVKMIIDVHCMCLSIFSLHTYMFMRRTESNISVPNGYFPNWQSWSFITVHGQF